MKESISNGLQPELLEYYQDIEVAYNRNIQMYHSLFYQNPDAIFAVDTLGNFTSANYKMLERMGCSNKLISKYHFSHFIHPDYLNDVYIHFNKLLLGEIQEFTTKGIVHNQEIIDINVKWLPIIVNEKVEGGYGIVNDITQNLKNEVEIKEVLESLGKAYVEKDNILESITEGFFAIDNSWKFVYCNRVVEHILGIEKQQIVGKHFWDLIDLANAPDILVQFKRSMEDKKRVNFEMYYPPFHTWLDITAYPNDNGLSSIIRVINEQKRIEQLFDLEKEALEMSADLHLNIETILTFLIDGLQKLHPDIMFSLWQVKNNALYNWYAPALPEDYKKMVHNFPIGINQGTCGTAAFTKAPVMVEDVSTSSIWEKYKDIAQQFGFKACWSLPLLNKEKEVFATFGVYFTEARKPTNPEINSAEKIKNLLTTIIINKKAEEEILISKERYDIVAMATNDIIWDYNLAAKTVVWNNGVTKTFGYEENKIKNSVAWAWSKVHPEDKLKAVASFMNHLENGSVTFSDEFRCKCADGSYKYVENKVFIINDSKTKKPLRFIGSIQDVTDKKNTEIKLRELNDTLKIRAEELATSNTELERFAYVASHDLQEPLRTVSSFLQLFKRRYADKIDATADNYINFAVDGADRMKQLINDMLEYSRVNTQLKLNEEVDMKQVLKEVIFNFSSKIKLSGAVIEIAEDLPKVYAVKTQMMQILQNLLSNAIKYQKPNIPPHITIKATERANEFEFSVTDEGIGIEPKFFDKIFIIFQRLHSKTQFSGTGIGLAICKKIMEKHNGKIWVESTLGEGSTFYFTIPKKLVSSI